MAPCPSHYPTLSSSQLSASPGLYPTQIAARCFDDDLDADSLWLMAPRWLWPEPARVDGQPLAPNFCPHIIHERAQLWAKGNYSALLNLATHSAAAPPRQHHHAYALQPGELDPGSARRIMHAAQVGKLTAAWRHLFSFGFASPGPDTLRALRDK